MRGLNRLAIADQALAIVDAEGPDGVSMRQLAERLGVTAMALYNHVEDKQDVLDAVAERVLSEIDLPSTRRPWADRLVGLFVQLRDAYLRHPRAVVLVQNASRATTPMLVAMEYALEALDEAGLDPMAALEAWSALVALTNGHAIYQSGHHLDASPQIRARIDPERFPAISRALTAGSFDWDGAFVAALRAQVSALERRDPRRSSSR